MATDSEQLLVQYLLACRYCTEMTCEVESAAVNISNKRGSGSYSLQTVTCC